MTDERVPAARSTPSAWLRRHPLVVAAALVSLALVLGLPPLARRAIQRVLGNALGVPVTIGAVWWNPLTGLATARGVSIGEGSDQMTAQRVAAVVDPVGLWRGGAVALERLELDAPTVAVSLDEQYRVAVGVLSGGEAATSAAPPVMVHELVVRDGELVVRHPVAGAVRSSALRIARLTATDLAIESMPSGTRLRLSGTIEGSIGGAPIEGEAQVRLAGDDAQITGTLSVTALKVNRDVLPLPPALEDFGATVDAHAKLDLAGQPLGGTMRCELTAVEARLSGAEGTEVSAKKVSLRDLQVDLSSRGVDLGAVTVDAPVLGMAVTPEGIVAPLPSAAGAGGPAWTVRSGVVQIRAGRITARRGDVTTALMLDSGRWDGLQPGRRSAVTATAQVEGGGGITVAGTLGAQPLAAELDVRLSDLSLPRVSQLAAQLPLRLSRGTADGTVHIAYKNGLQGVDAQVQAHDVHTAPPHPDRPSEVMAVDSAEIDLSVVAVPAPAVDVSRLTLHYPYVMVQRQQAGVFPYSVIASAEAAPPVGAENAQATPRVRVRRIEVEGGKIELVDTTQQPPYWTSLTDVSAVLEDVLPAQGTVARFEATGKQDELSPVEIAGTLTTDGLVARIAVQDMLLESMNTYVSPVLGYDFTAGRASVTVTASPAPPLIESTAEIILRGVDVLQTGLDVIQQQSGVPLPIALRLISNPSGEIRMKVPLFVDLKARSVELGSVIWQAVRRAIVAALTSPLRLLGSLFGTRGAPYAFAVDPIPFPSGSGSLDAAGTARVAEIARILQAHRGLLVVLMPQITEDDVRAVGPEKAARLAEARNAAVRDAFVHTAQLAADRILPVAWKPETRAQATGRPGVYVELQDAG